MKKLHIKLDQDLKIPKVRQLIDAIISEIRTQALQQGDLLPSVREISNELGLSKDTVVKAYSELKKSGIVDTTKAKGHYVANSSQKIFLFLDTFNPFKDILYNSFILQLGEEYTVDIGFHYYNEDIFETVITHNLGKYNYYVVMNSNCSKMHEVLKKIQHEKQFPVGFYANPNYEKEMRENDKLGYYAYKCLLEAEESIKKYNEFIYVDSPLSQHPKETQKWFIKFCKKAGLKYRIETVVKSKDVINGKLFWLVQHLDIVTLLKIAKSKDLKTGKNIGIICYNDSPMFEIIDNGITVISTDFAKMGKLAAEYIMNKKPMQITIPTSLIQRGSL